MMDTVLIMIRSEGVGSIPDTPTSVNVETPCRGLDVDTCA